MAKLVRPAHIHRERAAIIDFLSTYLSPEANDSRYEWLYCKNPEGMARVWVACETETGMITGVSAAFPRRIHRWGEEVRGYVLGDFCIHPDYRSLGPALALQRSSLTKQPGRLWLLRLTRHCVCVMPAWVDPARGRLPRRRPRAAKNSLLHSASGPRGWAPVLSARPNT